MIMRVDQPTSPTVIYYLPGRGGQLHTGLGEGLLRRGCDVTGRALVGPFGSMEFADQVDTVISDLQGPFSHVGALVVGNSFGAYLFLQAQVKMSPFVGRVLLFSPIVGSAESPHTHEVFVPPRSESLKRMVEAGLFPTPLDCQIHVGANDWQGDPENVVALGQKTGIPVTVVPGKGHMLGKDYVSEVLDGWLAR